MYDIQKKFKYPVGHRLSKYNGLCNNIHGHQLVGIISLVSNSLNDQDMVIDFSDIKKMIDKKLGMFDHCLMINKNDPNVEELKKSTNRLLVFRSDPTAEFLSRYIYYLIKWELESNKEWSHINMNFVKIFENENSSVTYSVENN